MISASYFDGNNGKRHAVTLILAGSEIRVVGKDVFRKIATPSARLGELFDHAPCVLQLADGARCEIQGPDARQALLTALGYRKPFIARWQDNWIGALGAIVMMLCIALATYFWGIPWAADRASSFIPVDMEKRLGDEELIALDKSLFKPTKLDAARQRLAQDVFRNIMPAAPRLPLKMEFRDAPLVGPNAFALPNGTIVVTDAMIAHITGTGGEPTTGLEEQLAGVLAHEIGHVQGRHGLKGIVASSIVGAFTWSLFGDFSAVAAGAPAYLLHMEYSRKMETAADDYAADLLKQHHIPATRLAELFESLEAQQKAKVGAKAPKLPGWMRMATDYLATHPVTAERIARLKAADGGAAAP